MSLHEVIVNSENFLVFDLDHLPARSKLEVSYVANSIKVFLQAHPMLKLLFENPECLDFVQSQRKESDTEYSTHITFNAQLPLKYQKQLANEIRTHLGIDTDIAIYELGKSLRLPGCIKIDKHNQIIPNSILECDEDDFAESSFTVRNKRNELVKTNAYGYLTGQVGNSIGSLKDYTIPDDFIQSLELPEQIKVNDVKVVYERHVKLDIEKTGNECVVCKRIHSVHFNKLYLKQAKDGV